MVKDKKKPKPSRSTKIFGVRKYQKNKTRPKKTTVLIKEDLGRFESITKYVMDCSVTESIVPKERNPNLVYLMKTPLKIVYYLDTERCFVYDLSGNYSGEFENKDLKRLFYRIGALLRYKK